MLQNIHPTKFSILQAAVEVFGKKGFNGATTKEIAKAAGISEGTIFRHFQNKTEILYEVVNSVVPLIGVEPLKECIEDCNNLDGREALQHIIQNRFETISASKVFMRIILTEIQYDIGLRNIYLKRGYEPICKILKEFLLCRMEKGEFRKINPEVIINVFYSYILFSIESQHLLGDTHKQKFLEQSLSRDLTDLLFDGIKGREGNE
ncbi:TetR/AcrR family transcriptional regulator [Anaerovorax odorimutans]|uniref:TetR/AcrR family transcriptional regulator n=1 Tax=Anaerovorax odorimutans TaxID=109327 RepID=UPI0003F796C8|nr:TetR/AcrR family transcriptional regulator [Anaerovorax odorimutans]